MKLAVILLSCLVGLSCQQSYGLWSSPMGPRPAFYHNVYADQLIHPSAVQSIESQDSPFAGVNDEYGGISPIQGRVPAKLNPQQRLFFYGNLFPHHRTTTVTVHKTVTTVVIKSCIPAGYFVENVAACPSRKKREILADESISPSQVEQMVTSVEPKLVQKRQNDDQPDIVSSLEKNQDLDFTSASQILRQKRIFDLGVATVTTTEIVFVATTIKTPIFSEPKGENVARCIPCVPSGLSICET